MRLVPLGTASADKNPTRAYSSYLLETKDLQVLVDAGSHRLLMYRGLDARRLRHVFLTHGHSDHLKYLGAVALRHAQARHLVRGGDTVEPLRVHVPLNPLNVPLAFGNLARWLAALGPSARRHVAVRFLTRHDKDEPKVVLRNEGAPSGTRLSVLASKARHPGGALAYAFLIREPGAREPLKVVFSGDTAGGYPPVARLAQGADYLFHETTFPHAYLVPLKFKYPRRVTHSSPIDAAKVARDAGVRVLGAVHYYDDRFPNKEAMRASMRAFFSGEVLLLEDLVPVELTPGRDRLKGRSRRGGRRTARVPTGRTKGRPARRLPPTPRRTNPSRKRA